MWPVMVTFTGCIMCRFFSPLRKPMGLMLVGFSISLGIYGFGSIWLYANAFVIYFSVMGLNKIPAGMFRDMAFQVFMASMTGFFIASSIGLIPFLEYLPILGMIQFLVYLIFVWECSTGRLESISLPIFLGWVGFPFQIMVWPSDFKYQVENELSVASPINIYFFQDLFIRIFMMSVSQIFSSVGTSLPPNENIYFKLLHLYLLAPWGWYLQAAALAGMMRDAGALAGISVPENFKSPFLATNISDFWSRWNIGATRAFRDILFFNRFGLSFYNPYLNTMIVFLAMGAWHAVNPYWLLFGFIHGIGFCIYIALGARLDWSNHWKLRLLGWCLTYLFVCTCWALPPQLIRISRNLLGNIGGFSNE